MTGENTPWTELVVALPAPADDEVEPVTPAVPARISTRLHNGVTSTLDVIVLARGVGLVRVEQRCVGRPPWRAWVPEGDVHPS